MKQTNILKQVFLIPVLAATLFLAGCENADPDKKTGSASKDIQQNHEKVLETVRPLLERSEYTLSLPGELIPYEQVSLYPKIKGFVREIYVDRGAAVKKGQLLALLEAPEVMQSSLSDRAAEQKFREIYSYSRQSYDRLNKASQSQGAVAALELEKAWSKLKSDSAAYLAAKASAGATAQLSRYLRITAPFDGHIVERNISAGALVGENNQTALFVLAQRSKLRLQVAVPEKHSSSLAKDTQATFTVNGLQDRNFNATLSRTSTTIQKAVRALITEFDIDNPGQLQGGEYAQVKLKLRRPENTFWLPASSIVQAQSGTFVLALRNGKPVRLPITTGNKRDLLTEVFGELSADEQYLKNGSEEL